jgi:membrane protein YqaA with SNARE-associated domain
MESLLNPEASLAGLFLASFLAATVLPGGSEVVFVALLLAHPEQAVPALLLATLGNTLGGMSTYALARLLPEKKVMRSGTPGGGAGETPRRKYPWGTVRQARIHAALLRHGAPALLLAWAPVIGDALCAAAGWLRLPWLACALWMALGKGARYALLAWGIS